MKLPRGAIPDLARAIGVPISTVDNWFRFGIPKPRRKEVHDGMETIVKKYRDKFEETREKYEEEKELLRNLETL